MTFLEKFFSMEYMLYPVCISLLCGAAYIILCGLSGMAVSETIVYVVSIIGFILGNLLKVKLIDKKENN